MRKCGVILFLMCITFAAFPQARMAEALSRQLQDAATTDASVKAIILLQDRLDIQKLDQQLYAENVTLQQRAQIVVQALQAKAAATQGPILEMLDQYGSDAVSSVRPFWVANMIAVEAKADIIYQLSERADVEALAMDSKLVRDMPIVVGAAPEAVNGVEPGLLAINAHLMWAAGFTGDGTIVMNLDTGVNGNHPALASRWHGNSVPADQAWFDPATSTSFPYDGDDGIFGSNHGTHTMGTMCGLDAATNDTVGVAFGAEWMASNSLVVLGAHTSASIASFEWAMDPDSDPLTTDGMPAGICNSWWDPNIDANTQCDAAINPYIDVVAAVEAAGIAVVFSAGNSGPGASTITQPKNVNTGLVSFWATGAVDANNVIASFSSRGPVHSNCTTGNTSLDIKPEASAPGVSVRSSSFNSYSLLSGTSMAAPHVVGAIALLRQAHPNATGTEIKLALYNTARDLGAAGEDDTYGMGIIDVWAAHQELLGGGGPVAPVVSDIADQTIDEGQSFATINLDDFVSDSDTDDASISWSTSGGSSITVSIDGSRVATVTAAGGFTGSETITFTATDPDGLSDSDDATFTVNTVGGGGNEPVVTGIPDSGITGAWVQLDLNIYVDDPDHSDSEMTWTFSGNTDLIIQYRSDLQACRVSTPAGWEGSERITFTATDPDGLSGSDDAVFFAGDTTGGGGGDPEPPVVSDIPDATITGAWVQIDLDAAVDDPDTDDSAITWTFSGNNNLIVQYRADRGACRVSAPAGFTGSETITFTATDPDGLSDSDDATFTVNAPNVANQAAEALALSGNYPNPFNPSTSIRFTVPAEQRVSLKIFNMLGQEVVTLVDGKIAGGAHEVVWDGRNDSGQQVASGTYVYRLTAGHKVVSKYMHLMK